MDRDGRAGRTLALAVLAVLWGGLAHRQSLPAPADLAPLVWAATATAFLAWFAVPRGSGCRRARFVVTTGVLGTGQLLSHAALAVGPLVAAQGHLRNGTGHAHGHGLTVAAGGPDLSTLTLLDALAHGGAGMAFAHLGATVAAAALWALAGSLWRTAVSWWRRVTVSLRRSLRTLRTGISTARQTVVTARGAFFWDGRGPPAPIGA